MESLAPSSSIRRRLGALAVLCLSLLSQQASAVVVRHGQGAPAQAFASAWAPAGYRYVNHCGLVRISETAPKARHSLRSAPAFRPAPVQSTALASLRSHDRELRQRLATGHRAWKLRALLRPSRPLRAQHGRARPGHSRQWPIRPPPSHTL